MPLAFLEGHSTFFWWAFGAGSRTRTDDLLITNQLLCQLSHTSMRTYIIITKGVAFVKGYEKET